jgi:hypothetical protein
VQRHALAGTGQAAEEDQAHRCTTWLQAINAAAATAALAIRVRAGPGAALLLRPGAFLRFLGMVIRELFLVLS